MDDMTRKRKRIALFLSVAAVAVALDQLTKAWIWRALPDIGQSSPLVPGVIRLCHVENIGAAFSIGEGKGFVFVAIAVAIFALTLAATVREDLTLPMAGALGAVAGGGLGNMIDRLAHGSVTDFLATTFIDFPVFNVADIFVTAGVAIVLLLLVFGKGERG